jgi:hypothetical protein
MTRVVSLFLPTSSTDRVRRKAGGGAPPPEAPLVLVGREGRRRVVLAADAAAQAAGFRVGMPATKAQVLVPGLAIQDADPSADADAIDRLALWMLQRFVSVSFSELGLNLGPFIFFDNLASNQPPSENFLGGLRCVPALVSVGGGNYTAGAIAADGRFDPERRSGAVET